MESSPLPGSFLFYELPDGPIISTGWAQKLLNLLCAQVLKASPLDYARSAGGSGHG
jgi:hypothetical protein